MKWTMKYSKKICTLYAMNDVIEEKKKVKDKRVRFLSFSDRGKIKK